MHIQEWIMVATGVGQFGQTVKHRAAVRIPLDKGFERCSNGEMNNYTYTTYVTYTYT